MGVRSFLILLTGMLMGGLTAVYFGKELNWDLANYHYYNPFYFLQQRWNVDYWPPSFVHVHFTPTLDFLTYFLINNVPSKAAVFILGAIHGINFWLLFCISRLLLSLLPRIKLITLYAFFIALLGMYGPTVLPGMGSFQHDNLVSLFVLAFVLLQLKCLQHYAHSGRFPYPLLVLCSVLLGVGVGGKLTAGIFVGGALLSFLFLNMSWHLRIGILCLFSVGVGMGMLLSSGYWMLFLWQAYHNPFFPLWNGIFHSPDFPFYNWHDQRFLPKSVSEALFFPFYFSTDGRTGDMPFQDFRFAVLYVLFFVYAAVAWLKKQTIRDDTGMIRWLFLFFIFTYVLWQSYFSIMRYIAALEMLAPLLIFLLLYQLIKDGVVRFASVLLVFLFVTGTMMPTSMVRAQWYGKDYFNVKLPGFVKQVPEATVLVAFPAFALNTFPRPQAYLIPFFPAKWRFIGIPFLRQDYTLPEVVPGMVKHEQMLYLLSSPAYMPTLYSIADTLGFSVRQACHSIDSDRQAMTHEDMWLCAVKK